MVERPADSEVLIPLSGRIEVPRPSVTNFKNFRLAGDVSPASNHLNVGYFGHFVKKKELALTRNALLSLPSGGLGQGDGN